MRVIAFFVAACVWVAPARASLILLSDTRSVGASAYNSIQNSSQNQAPSAPFADFAGSVSGSVDGAGGGASQNSSFGSDQIHVEGDLMGWCGVWGQFFPDPQHSRQESIFEITFSLTEPAVVTLSGYRDQEALAGYFNIGASLGVPLQWGGSPYGNYLTYSGLLEPGTYSVTADAFLGYDGFGTLWDSGTLHYSLDLDFSTVDQPLGVPDGTSTGMLLGLALAGLFAWRRWCRP